jgi:glutathione S-transferase
MLAYLATELHKPFVRHFFPTSAAEKKVAAETIGRRLGFVSERLQDDYLFGREASVADAYLYVMLRWARMSGLSVPEPLPAFYDRMEARPAVRLALQHEGLA